MGDCVAPHEYSRIKLLGNKVIFLNDKNHVYKVWYEMIGQGQKEALLQEEKENLRFGKIFKRKIYILEFYASMMQIKGFKIPKITERLLEFFKWGVISSIAILIGRYIVNKLAIVNYFYAILLTAAILSIVIQAVISHSREFRFKMRWFIFYFLIYTAVIWFVGQYVLPNFAIESSILSAVIIGLVISATIIILEQIDLKSRTIPWVSVVLILILVVSNLGYLQSTTSFGLPTKNKNSSTLAENVSACPTPNNVLQEFESTFNPDSVALKLNGFVDTSVWRIENLFSSCYKGKYKGQYPDRYYCDNLIVSRWETSSSGAINYRWYTAVTAELSPQKITSGTVYALTNFLCENGQKVTVEKGTTNYYVYDSRSGGQIRIAY